jgi:hypothetical protein
MKYGTARVMISIHFCWIFGLVSFDPAARKVNSSLKH